MGAGVPGVNVAVGDAPTSGDAVGVSVAPPDSSVLVAVGVGVSVGVHVAERVSVPVAVDVAIGVSVGDGVW